MKTGTEQFYREAINRAVEYIEAHAGGPVYLDDVAEAAHLSAYHFHRIFKAFTGLAIHEYLIRIRLEKAASALVNSEKPVIDIALECGFNSAENFTRAFGNYFSLSPSEFRKQGKLEREQKTVLFKTGIYMVPGLSGPENSNPQTG